MLSAGQSLMNALCHELLYDGALDVSSITQSLPLIMCYVDASTADYVLMRHCVCHKLA